MLDIQQREQGNRGAFYIPGETSPLGEMTYTRAGDHRIIIDHTEVSDALRGQGAGKQLVTRAVEYARAHQVKILPLCPFAKSVFERTPEFADVWDR